MSKPTPHQIVALDLATRNPKGEVCTGYFFPTLATLRAATRRGWLEALPDYPGDPRPCRYRLTDAGRAVLATCDAGRAGEDLMIRALTK